MSTYDVVALFVALAGVVVTGFGVWHTYVVKPLRSENREAKADMHAALERERDGLANTIEKEIARVEGRVDGVTSEVKSGQEDIQTLQISHAKLDTTLAALTEAINRLNKKLD